MKNLEEMKLLLAQFLNTSNWYDGLYIMEDDCINGSNTEGIIGLCFEESQVGMDYSWFNEEEPTELEEFIYSHGYSIEWYNSIEAHIYKN